MDKQKNQNQKELDFKDLIHLEETFSNIRFYGKNHTYTIDGEPAKTSVSGLIKKYEKEFESEKIAGFVARKEGKHVQDVLNEWEFSKDYSCHKGSEFHSFVENYFTRKNVILDKDSIEYFFQGRRMFYEKDSIEKYYKELALLITNFTNFYNWWKQDHFIIKSEFVIGDKESGICGTIDNLSFNKKTKEMVIFDYKTNKEIKKINPRGDNLLKTFNYLPQCEYIKYSLQMSLYSLIIEKNTSFEIPKSYIVWVGGKEEYELIECLDLKKEAKMMLDNVSK